MSTNIITYLLSFHTVCVLGKSHLYSLIALLETDNLVLDSLEKKIGIRTVRIVENPDPDGIGKNFYIELNGVPVFAKGANYIPNDMFLPRITAEEYERVVKSAADANMNMLRVWGGGIYEDDIFYELCDNYGIMLWQDFMFACSMYPGDRDFLENVEHEVTDNIIRLRNHPSIVLWCGNNEIEVAWAQGNEEAGWGWKQKYNLEQRKQIWDAYEKIFHRIIPDTISRLTDKAFYWRSSPSAGKDLLASYETKSGDMHYWGVWHGKHSFSDFNKYKARFMSEYGFQSFPEFKSVRRYTIPEDYNIESEVMTSHQRSGIGNLRIKEYMEADYKTPKDFESFLYVSQVLQSEGMKAAFEAHRRAKPYCMGSLYWQLNDCWPAASWTGIDYYRRWKALHYLARRSFSETLIAPYINGDKIEIYLITDRNKPFITKIHLELMDFSGKIIWKKILTDKLSSKSSKITAIYEKSDLIKDVNETEVFLFFKITEKTGILKETNLSENILYFTKPKNLKLEKPSITKMISKSNNGYRISLQTDRLSKNVFLNIDEGEGFFTDNYFDLIPDRKTTIEFKTKIEISHFASKLSIKTLFDSY